MPRSITLTKIRKPPPNNKPPRFRTERHRLSKRERQRRGIFTPGEIAFARTLARRKMDASRPTEQAAIDAWLAENSATKIPPATATGALDASRRRYSRSEIKARWRKHNDKKGR